MARHDWNDDPYTQKARREGYLARSAYKLLEIQQKRSVLTRGDLVLDLGCAPGAWLQVASKIVGAKGRIVGIDLQSVEQRIAPNVKTLTGDAFEVDAAMLAEAVDADLPCFDVVLSDMAPKTGGGGGGSGDHFQSMHLCERAMEVCDAVLRPGGKFVMKALEGEGYQDLLQSAKERFSSVRGMKPKASRSRSREMFVVCEGFVRRAGSEKNNSS